MNNKPNTQRVLFFASFPEETESVALSLSNHWTEVCARPFVCKYARLSNGHEAFLIESGIGAWRVACAVQWAACNIDAEIAILTGCAGALIPAIPIGTATFATEVMDGDARDPLTTQCKLPPQSFVLRHRELRGARYTSVQRIIDTQTARRELLRHTSADVVDCEAVHFAASCELNGIRWYVLKVIVDNADSSANADNDTIRGHMTQGYSSLDWLKLIATVSAISKEVQS